MAGLFLAHGQGPGFAPAHMPGAIAHELGAWRLFHAPGGLFQQGDDLVAVAGTLVCDGKMGRDALAALSTMDPLALDWSRIGGQFIALVRKGGRSFLFTDYFAAFQLFHDAEMRLFSTSLLAAASALPRLSFDPQGVYEFAFNVVPIGNDTVFAELKTLGPDAVVELTEGGAKIHSVTKPLPTAGDTSIEAHRDRLMAVIEPHVRHFGDNLHCPLSGGLDSRLVLAALRAAGANPHIYVYGGPDSADVRIAREIAAAQGFAIDWLDKEAWRAVAPDEFPEIVARNFEIYDGLPNYGELFENGANAFAREARHKGGALSASGGCGEIYRNFFFLPDRRFSAAAVARTFYARYAKGDVTEVFDERGFLRAIEDKILAALDRPGDRSLLPRPLIEQIYPRVRCRAVFGREISLEARVGPYLMPFLDHQVVAEAMKLPLALKNGGRFEAMLLNAIDPALARFPSAYGHDFAGPPGRRHLFAEWSTRIRPIALRQRSYALRRRLGPVADEHGGLLTPEYMGRVVDLEFPAMRRFFRPEAIADSGLMRRIANLEYLAARLSVS